MNKLIAAIFGKTEEGSTERLLQLSIGYYFMYIVTGYLAKHFDKVLGVGGIQYTFYNTIGGMLICNLIVIVLGWYKFKSSNFIYFWGMKIPKELLYIVPSGICTAVVIPTTTLMYTLPISVMVAMIIMRASIVIISRIIDEIQIRIGILKKKVYWEENIAVFFAVLAVSLKFFYVKPGDFDFIHNKMAMTILAFYLAAYSIRIYIMNYYKNTRPKGAIYDTKGFFAIEQIASTISIVIAGYVFFVLVNRPVNKPYQLSEIPAITQSLSTEKAEFLKTLDSAQNLLYKETSKFSPEQREKIENTILSAKDLIEKGKDEEIKNINEDIQKEIKNVKMTFAYQFSYAIKEPTKKWFATIISGLPFGLAAFFSVFLFMFKGRTATFAGLVNRLTSLVAGTTAIILIYLFIKGQKPPTMEDWLGLLLIFIAIYFIGRAEKKRACELLKEGEIKDSVLTSKMCYNEKK